MYFKAVKLRDAGFAELSSNVTEEQLDKYVQWDDDGNVEEQEHVDGEEVTIACITLTHGDGGNGELGSSSYEQEGTAIKAADGTIWVHWDNYEDMFC